MGRVIVIGLDGATWDILDPLIIEKYLPNTKNLKENGVHATLISTIPPVTGPAWTSLITGVNPGKHGIFGFQSLKNGVISLNTSQDIKSLTILEILSNKNLTNIVIGLPLSFPPLKNYKGIMISDFLYPIKAIFPPSKRKYLKDYEVVPSLFKNGVDLIKDMIETANKQIKTAKLLFKEESWDFFFFLYSEIDQVCHKLWEDLKNRTPLGQEAKKIFLIADQFLGWIMNNMQKDDLLIICSDHGFGNNKYSLRINTLLKKKGLIKTKLIANFRINSPWANILRMRDDTYIERKTFFSKLFQYLFNCSFLKILFVIDSKYKNFLLIKLINSISKKLTGFSFYREIIDYSNSKAFEFITDWMGIRINGSEDLKNKLINYFKRLKYKNQLIFNKIIKNTEIYSGDFIKDGPDVLLLSNNFLLDASMYKKLVLKNQPPSTHKLNGVFIAYGKNIKKGKKFNYFQIYDIAPTILYYLNLPYFSHMDGKVLTEIFQDNYILRRREAKNIQEEEKINIKIEELVRLKKI